jgi:hypothetical protein
LAGPGSVVGLDDAVRSSLLDQLCGGDEVEAALSACGHVDVRRRVLTGEVTTKVVLGLALYSGQGYDSVLATVIPRLPAIAPATKVPTGSALSQARTRVSPDVFANLFYANATPSDPPVLAGRSAEGSRAFGLELTAFDGTTMQLADTDSMRECFATPTGGQHPQARLVTLITCATRRVKAAAVGSYATSEQELVDTLREHLRPGTLNLADRNFFSMARFLAFADTGAHLAWRVKNSNQHLPAKIVTRLPDGSSLIRLHESARMLARRRRISRDATLPRLADTTMRLVEFDLHVTDGRGRTRRSRFRIVTTLLDHTAFPAKDIAAVYAQRWQAEVGFYRIKHTLRGTDTILRGQTPDLARQEIWAMLYIYNKLCDLTVDVANYLGVDPDAISFVAVVRLTRTHAAPACGCANLSQSTQALTAAIVAHPTQRMGRQRTSPRTAQERRTEQTRSVTYMINTVTSNLPEMDIDL